MYPDYANKLIALKERDLAHRNRLVETGHLSQDGYDPEMARVHRENTLALEEIIDAIGYPTIDKVGKQGSEAAWLVIQHAIGQPAFMRKCATLLARAVAEQRASAVDLAYLTDRIAVFEGRSQLYGTQFDWDENGEMSPQHIADIETVNRRRVGIGLPRLEEQIKRMRARVLAEKLVPPSDLAERTTRFDAWRRSVGWL